MSKTKNKELNKGWTQGNEGVDLLQMGGSRRLKVKGGRRKGEVGFKISCILVPNTHNSYKHYMSQAWAKNNNKKENWERGFRDGRRGVGEKGKGIKRTKKLCYLHVPNSQDECGLLCTSNMY